MPAVGTGHKGDRHEDITEEEEGRCDCRWPSGASWWSCFEAPLWRAGSVSCFRAIVLSQRVGPVAQGAHVTQGAARGHPAEAVGAVTSSVATAPGSQAQGFPEGVLEAAGHEAVEHGVDS